jgi:selenium donor protein
VGTETADDAGVYRLDDRTAIVQTLDFSRPSSTTLHLRADSPPANAISDIYAMGARPLFALNIAGFPRVRLPLSALADILRGGADKAREAGIPVLGGHTVDDSEPKYGLVVTGLVDPHKVARNAGARAGDQLVLTKPLGTGIVSNPRRARSARRRRSPRPSPPCACSTRAPPRRSRRCRSTPAPTSPASAWSGTCAACCWRAARRRASGPASCRCSPTSWS